MAAFDLDRGESSEGGAAMACCRAARRSPRSGSIRVRARYLTKNGRIKSRFGHRTRGEGIGFGLEFPLRGPFDPHPPRKQDERARG